MEWWKFVVLIVGGYLVGNIFWARIISKIKHFDIQKAGSGNPGTMNMLRNLGFFTGITTLLLDMSKGFVPSLIGFYLFGGASGNGYVGLFVAGLSVLIGNIFPIFYKFKGGKGAAVVYGMFVAANPVLSGILFFVGFVFLLIFDYASLLSFLVISVCTIYEAYALGLMSGSGNVLLSILLFAIFCLVWFAHRQNIFRLLTGKENKVNFMSKLFKKYKKLRKGERHSLIEIYRLRKAKKQELRKQEIG